MNDRNERLQLAIRAALPELIRAMEPEVAVPQSGEFHPVQVTFRNPDKELYAGRIHMVVLGGKEAGSKLRFVDVKVETPSGKSMASSQYAFVGLKREILHELKAQQASPAILLDSILSSIQLLRDAEKV